MEDYDWGDRFILLAHSVVVMSGALLRVCKAASGYMRGGAALRRSLTSTGV
jgi:hypothetical protein